MLRLVRLETLRMLLLLMRGALAIPVPVQAPQPPPPPPVAGRSMHQRLGRLEEEICMTQLMKASGQTYQAFDGTFRGSSPAAFERLIMEYLVNISKRRAFWSLNEDILKINDSDYQYAVSIKEDTAYPCLHSPKTTKETRSIRRIQRRPIRRIEDIVCEDSGRYQAWSLLQETPIRRIQSIGYAVSKPTPDSINRKLKNEF
ncbi:hypothetical protein Tco_0886946 [Tanacetum coccineum]